MLHQLAGKAARDGFYLTHFGPSRLPEMVAAAAAFSLLASFLAGRMLGRFSPARLLPGAFLISGVLQIGEWFLLLRQPGVASVVVYLHMFALGALLFSGFWAMLSEEFDPREAKVKIGRVAAAGTAGALAGGVIAERVVAWFRAESLMLLLSLVHVLCGLLLWQMLRESSELKNTRARPRPAPSPQSPVQDRRYLVTLAALVLIASVSAVLLDFVFKFSATDWFGKGPGLVRFFALFYTGVSLLTLLLQSLASRRALETVGLGRTMGALPATVIGGSCLSMLFPGISLPILSVARGAEASVRGSLFRAGYEVCFTPVPALEKRRMKPLIDVGAERLGDLAGSAIVGLVLLLTLAQPRLWILSTACALGGGALILARAVDKAYVRALARSLMHRGAELDLDASLDLTTRTVLSQSGLQALQSSGLPSAPLTARFPAIHREDPVLFQLACLRSRDAGTVRAALEAADPAHPLIAAQLVQLLASTDFGPEAVIRLRPVAERFVGLLCDHLRDPGQDFQVRRKIPGLLAGAPGQRAANGLMGGLEDERFEVRCQCSRALLRLKRVKPELRFDQESILTAVDRELSAGKIFREGQRLGELDSQVLDKEWLDEFLKERAHIGLEHVFTLLALIYPQEALLVAFRALHVEDRHLHGTALEYLDSILPARTRQLLWQVVGEQPALSEARDAGAVLDDLMKASATVVIKLKGAEEA
jgi:AAA family ATP:ADP antiporter